MKLLELTINNTRGIVKLVLEPAGKSFVVIGPNGTGKTAIVDALDFLFTGEMSRFSGRQGFDLKRHGKHINAEKESCLVSAKVKLREVEEPVELCRRFLPPYTLEITPPDAISALQPFLSLAQQHHYLLTRQNLLKFVTARPQERAEQVQALLNINELETIRKALVKACNSVEGEVKAGRVAVLSAYGVCSATLGLQTWEEASAKLAVNKLRATLDATPVPNVSDAKKNLTPPALSDVGEKTLESKSPQTAIADIVSVGKSFSDDAMTTLDAQDASMLVALKALSENPEKVRAAHQLELVELGLSTLAGEDACPLCDTPWDKGTLKVHLETKAAGAREIAPTWQKFTEANKKVREWQADHVAALGRIVKLGRIGDSGTDPSPLSKLAESLSDFRTAVTDPLQRYIAYRAPGKSLSDQLEISKGRELLRALYTERKPEAAKTPRQVAWDTLTRVEENLKAINSAREVFNKAQKSFERLDALRTAFIASRDNTLNALYNSVQTRFEELYRQLHAPDEETFTASITPTDTGLKFSVGFHNIPEVTPHTLHSEGHQDSMGLCLFLALAEKLQGDHFEFCLLDDVVMAIDAGHRRQICRLIKSLQPNTQFIITTHDQVWAKQLMTENCVSKAGTRRFLGWSLDGGPVDGILYDFLSESQEALTRGNVRDAAASLRHGMENYLHMVASSISAEVPYSLSGQYEMGDMMSACSNRLKNLLKAGKNAAQSWKDDQGKANCEARDLERGNTMASLQVEQWAVNPNVHFNSWMDMTPQEFAPVLSAFERYCSLFKCPTCKSLLHVIFHESKDYQLACDASCQPIKLLAKGG